MHKKGEIEGIELGKEKEENVLISLIEGDCISPVVAAEMLNISIDELNRYLPHYGSDASRSRSKTCITRCRNRIKSQLRKNSY